VKNGQLKFAGMLLRSGKVHVDSRDTDRGWTPLLCAVTSCSKELYAEQSSMVTLLLKGGADVDAEDSQQERSLQHAMALGSLNLAELLLDNHAKVGCKDAKGRTRPIVRGGRRLYERTIALPWAWN
jgi:ankyrin repeat protein